LPEEVCVRILLELDIGDRFNTALTCKRWHDSLKSGALWFNTTVTFTKENDVRHQNVAKNHGKYIRKLHLKCHQQSEKNCQNACSFLESLIQHNKDLRIQSFKIEFCEENPLFYSGALLLGTLKRFFLHPAFVKSIEKIDLSQFPVAIDNDLLNAISENHCNGIKYLNIQNEIFATRISHECVTKFISKASSLESLHIPYSCFESRAFMHVSKNTKLQFISLILKRSDKFFIGAEDWNFIRDTLPDLRIELNFDSTCPLQSTYKVMLPEVPVVSLKLYINTTLNDHINIASSIYKRTLRVLEVTSSPAKELDDAVLNAVRECKRLESIHVWSYMSRDTVDKILKTKRFSNYTLVSRN